MISNSDIYDFMLDNIQKIVIPEEIINIELSISRYEFLALMLTEKQQTITMSTLAQGMGVPLSTATGIVDRLVKRGMLTRDRCEDDRRIVIVFLTGKGGELVERVQEHFYDFLDRVRSLLTDEELELGLTLVRKVVAGFQQEKRASGEETSPPRRNIAVE